MTIVRSEIIKMDEQDPLRTSCEAFQLPKGIIYLDGNSLGAMPKAVVQRMQEVVSKEWAEQLIHSWNDNNWFILSQTIGDKIARLIGAEPGEVIVSDCVSVNLFKLVVAALNMQKGRVKVVTELGNFPTDLYVLQGIARMFNDAIEIVAVDRSELMRSIDDDTAIVVLTHVHYKTSEVFDMDVITRQAHKKGALILWDLCHTAGAMEVELTKLEVDMAVGCGYKYLNGGPGAPAFLYIAKHLQADVHQPLSGWWGHSDPFAFDDIYTPAADIRRAQSGTQSVLALSALEVGIDTALSVEMAEVRNKSQKLGDLFIELVQHRCPDINIASPLDNERRGSHVSIRHKEGYAITRALNEQGVIVDFRAPDIIRFGIAPLYISYLNIWDTVEMLANILKTNAWDKEEFKQKAMVT
ncbi:MAG: kynureninase [Gammaproteobacteria bacterium]|jgi:kynureninase